MHRRGGTRGRPLLRVGRARGTPDNGRAARTWKTPIAIGTRRRASPSTTAPVQPASTYAAPVALILGGASELVEQHGILRHASITTTTGT